MNQLGNRVLLSVQRALTDNVEPHLRGVACDWRESYITIRYLFDGEISEDDRDSCEVAASEVAADFPDGWKVNDEIIRYDVPKRLEEMSLKAWAFRRKE